MFATDKNQSSAFLDGEGFEVPWEPSISRLPCIEELSLDVLWLGKMAGESVPDLAVWSVVRPVVQVSEDLSGPIASVFEPRMRAKAKAAPETAVPLARFAALRPPVHEGDSAMAFAPYPFVGEEAENDAARFEHPANLVEDGVQVGNVLHHLIIDDNIEGLVWERNAVLHLRNSTLGYEARRNVGAVTPAVEEDIASVRINAIGEQQFNDLPLTAAVVENAPSALGGEVSAELVVIQKKIPPKKYAMSCPKKASSRTTNINAIANHSPNASLMRANPTVLATMNNKFQLPRSPE